MDVKFSFSKEDYKAIASELYALMVAQAVPAGFQPAPATAPVAVVPMPAPVPIPAPAPAPAPAPVQYVTAPVAAAPPVLPKLDAVTYSAGLQGTRLDDAVGAGTPGTITLPSGRTLSVPVPGSETFVSYVRRVARQLAANGGRDVTDMLGILFQGTEYIFSKFGGWKSDGSNWPIAADFFANPGDYADPAEKAKADAATAAYNASIGWDGVPGHANDPWISSPSSPQPAPVPRLDPAALEAKRLRHEARQAGQVPAQVYESTPVKIEQ